MVASDGLISLCEKLASSGCPLLRGPVR